MQANNQFTNGNIMPLLMNFTAPSPIQENSFNLPSMGYNDDTQISYEMRLVTTRCAITRSRTRGPYSDLKNENDDTKSVR
jgi:hypothetical protein